MSDNETSGCGCRSTTPEETEAGSDQPQAGDLVSFYRVPKMDCPSEERMIRMALNDQTDIRRLNFDLTGRTLTVVHGGSAEGVTSAITPLGLGATLEKSEPYRAEHADQLKADPSAEDEAGVLKILLAINGVMFALELLLGIMAQSTGLIADSLDMFADAAVYGLALYAVAHSARTQMKAARLAGILQLLLAVGVLLEVGRRFLMGSEPVSGLMMSVSTLALIANVTCLVLISRHRDGGVHMKASWIFSANDVLINLGVIAAGLLVWLTGSALPDLLIGSFIGLIVLNGARRILALKADTPV